ncbi:hypothetical protein Tco_1109122 [Tanacetum coccineum]
MKEQAYNVDRDKDHKSLTTKEISLVSRRSVIMNSLQGRVDYLVPTSTFGTRAGGVRHVNLLSGIQRRITVDRLGALDSIAEIALDSNTSFALSATAYDPPSDSVDQGIWRISCITFVMAAEDQLS